MGVVTESIAANNAKFLEEALTNALNTKNPQVIAYAKTNLLKRYYAECCDGWLTPESSIVEAYKNV